MLVRRLRYYFSSIPTLFGGFRNWPKVLALFLGWPLKKPVTLQLRDGLRFKVRTPMDAWVIKESCLDDQYQGASTELADGWTVIDVGAGLGDFTISVARRHPHSTVYAYEPYPGSFSLLQENLTLNGIENVKAFPWAIGAREGSMTLRFVSAEAVQHSTASVRPTENGGVQVPSVSLDQIFTRFHLTTCHYLKMDCEGGEYDILLNTNPEVLVKIQHLCLEYHDGVTSFSHADLVTFFEKLGFVVKLSPNPVHPHLGYLYAANRAGSNPKA